jgi:hypothetical protein
MVPRVPKLGSDEDLISFNSGGSDPVGDFSLCDSIRAQLIK